MCVFYQYSTYLVYIMLVYEGYETLTQAYPACQEFRKKMADSSGRLEYGPFGKIRP